jgi:hypothetical protein
MKSIILISLMTMSISGFSQDVSFKVTSESITDFLITPCENKTQIEIYKKTIEWISITFKNSKQVIQSQIENDMIRIEGFTESFNGGPSSAVYLIEISFKEGKYKFDPLEFTIINGVNKFKFFPNFATYFKSDGSVKERLKDTVSGVEDTFNVLNLSLKEYIMEKKSDW